MDFNFETYAIIILALLLMAEFSVLAMVFQASFSCPDMITACLIMAFYFVTGFGFALATIFAQLPVNEPASIFALVAWGVLCLFIAVLAFLDFFARKVLARCIDDLQFRIAVHDEDGDVCPHQGCLDTMKELRDDRMMTFSRIGFAAKELFGRRHEVAESEVGEEVNGGSIHGKTEV